MSLTADSRGKKTTVTMKISIKFVFTIIFYFSFCISPSLSQGNCPTYVVIPGSQPKNSMTQLSSNCSSACQCNTSCSGFTQQGGSCLLNVGNPNDINYNTTGATYSVILRTNCNTGQMCSWNAKTFTFGRGGNWNNMTTINNCLLSCQMDSACTGLDWDSKQNACFVFNVSGFPIANSDVVHHFDKNCSAVSTIGTTIVTQPTAQTSLLPVTPFSTVTASPCSRPCTGGSVCSASGLCVCNTVCSLENDPVCGNDSVTYDNECIFNMATCTSNSSTIIKSRNACGAVPNWNPMAIKPAYIVLAGVGGGCLLLVITAVIILCEYSMNDETFTHGVVKSPAPASAKQQQVQVEEIDIAVVEGDNVEFNPYYNRSEIDAPDFTKEENLM